MTVLLTLAGFALLLALWTYVGWENWDVRRRERRERQRALAYYEALFDLDPNKEQE
jgi:predicted negative regulator of RcsB-dependent stress response